MTRASVFQPVLSTILRDRKFALAICAVGSLQLVLGVSRLPGWPCPFFHALGLPCPGCGMSRAMLLIFSGHWRQAIVLHAFAPLFLAALLIITLCAVAPRAYVIRVADKTEKLERFTGITGLLLIGLIVYWLARLAFMQAAFVRMIQG